MEKEVNRVSQTFPRRGVLASPCWSTLGLSTMKMPGSSEHPNTLPEAHLSPSDHLQSLTRRCLTSTQQYCYSPLFYPLLQVPSAVPITGWYARGGRPKGPHLIIPARQGLTSTQEMARLDQPPAEKESYVRPAPCSTHTQNPDNASM